MAAGGKAKQPIREQLHDYAHCSTRLLAKKLYKEPALAITLNLQSVLVVPVFLRINRAVVCHIGDNGSCNLLADAGQHLDTGRS